MYRYMLRHPIITARESAQRAVTRALDAAPGRLPRRVVNHITLGNLGRLTASDPRLGQREVPTITVQEICEAVKLDEGRVALA